MHDSDCSDSYIENFQFDEEESDVDYTSDSFLWSPSSEIPVFPSPPPDETLQQPITVPTGSSQLRGLMTYYSKIAGGITPPRSATRTNSYIERAEHFWQKLSTQFSHKNQCSSCSAKGSTKDPAAKKFDCNIIEFFDILPLKAKYSNLLQLKEQKEKKSLEEAKILLKNDEQLTTTESQEQGSNEYNILSYLQLHQNNQDDSGVEVRDVSYTEAFESTYRSFDDTNDENQSFCVVEQDNGNDEINPIIGDNVEATVCLEIIGIDPIEEDRRSITSSLYISSPFSDRGDYGIFCLTPPRTRTSPPRPQFPTPLRISPSSSSSQNVSPDSSSSFFLRPPSLESVAGPSSARLPTQNSPPAPRATAPLSPDSSSTSTEVFEPYFEDSDSDFPSITSSYLYDENLDPEYFPDSETMQKKKEDREKKPRKKHPLLSFRRIRWKKPYPRQSMCYVVRDIVARRLVNDTEEPGEKDYEYLIAWEGYASDENTWEPYSHLTGCRDKLAEFLSKIHWPSSESSVSSD